MKEYKNKEICIKTKKIPVKKKDPLKLETISEENNSKRRRAVAENEANTLIVVKKKIKPNRAVYEKDYMTEIVNRGMRPMDFLLCKKQPNLDDDDDTEDSQTTKGKLLRMNQF
jgi:hypothetical protein